MTATVWGMRDTNTARLAIPSACDSGGELARCDHRVDVAHPIDNFKPHDRITEMQRSIRFGNDLRRVVIELRTQLPDRRNTLEGRWDRNGPGRSRVAVDRGRRLPRRIAMQRVVIRLLSDYQPPVFTAGVWSWK